MIHHVKLPPKADRLLRDIVTFQVTALKLAARFTASDIRNPKKFEDLVGASLECKGWDKDLAVSAAKWITRKTDTLFENLANFAGLGSCDKQRLVAKIQFDLRLIDTPRDATLKATIRSGKKKSSEPSESVNAFFSYFYDLWSDGFDTYLFRRETLAYLNWEDRSEKYSYKEYVREFIETNPSLSMCAVCDGVAYSARADDQSYTSIDHFFPRSIYPQFTCHPRNLIPICSFCNSAIKKSADPLAYAGSSRPLDQIRLPYQDNSLAKQAWISISDRTESTKSDAHPWTIILKSALDQDVTSHIQSLNGLYKVQERWDTDLTVIEEQAFRRICQFLMLEVAPPAFPSPNELVQKLELMMAITERDNMGRDPYAFMILWLLHKYILLLEEKRTDATIYGELKEWAKEQRMYLENLVELAKNIRGRISPSNEAQGTDPKTSIHPEDELVSPANELKRRLRRRLS